MKRPRLALVNVRSSARPVVLAAAHAAFPTAEVDEPHFSLPSRLEASIPASDLVVLFEPDPALVAAAAQAADAEGRPRWGVVVLGDVASPLAETVPAAEWTPAGLARVFRLAYLQHTLLLENLALRGDLKTLSRRISHDLRTPVGCIQTSSDLLDELSIGKGFALANVSEIFRQSGREISAIVERVSFLLKASLEPPARSPVDMGKIVAAALAQLEPDIRRTGASFTQPDSWPEVTGVSAWLQVVWWNLLHNALIHANAAPQVRIAWAHSDDGGVRCSVMDRGPGVIASRRDSLFLPFDQLHERRSAGLGLSIVHRLVSLHGGTCSYEQSAESGTCFHFTLPAKPDSGS